MVFPRAICNNIAPRPRKNHIYITYIPFIGIYPIHYFLIKTLLLYSATKNKYSGVGGYTVGYIPHLRDICENIYP